MSRASVQQLMVGLPGAGKSTFLAAFWHVLHSDEVPGALKLAGVTGDRTYLNGLAEKWRRCEELGRTPIGGEEVSMLVKNPGTSETTELFVPDMSGETFEVQWEARESSVDYAEKVAGVSGVLLFLHPDTTKETDSIATANDVLTAWAEEPAKDCAKTKTDPKPWQARHAPTQVKVVELLQFLTAHRDEPTRVAILISAWDLVGGKATAESWIGERLPLLSQYLKANAPTLPSRVYGLSAQGGDLGKDSDALFEHAAPSKRIRITGPEVTPHDITAPVKWLMGG